MRIPHIAAAALLLAVASSGVRADGVIDTSGATLTLGTGTPQGTLTTAPALPAGPAPTIPAVGTLGSIGTFSSTMPAFPGGGTGVDGAFTVVATSPPNAVTCTGPFADTSVT